MTTTAVKRQAVRRLLALDAAPQDGRWLDDPETVARIVKFLVSKLSPADLAELDDQLADGTEPQAADSRLPEGEIRTRYLDYTPGNRRQIRKALKGAGRGAKGLSMDQIMKSDPDYGKSLEERFPNMNRLKRA